MKEKKLSKDELIMNLDKMIEDYKNEIGWCDVWEKTTNQIRQRLEAQAEPSDAKLEEFVEKWADIVTPVVLINNKMRPQLMKAMQKDLINMLKEYDALRRG